jgi:hypothetical protein
MMARKHPRRQDRPFSPIHWVEAWVVRDLGPDGSPVYYITMRNSLGGGMDFGCERDVVSVSRWCWEVEVITEEWLRPTHRPGGPTDAV